MLHCTLTARTLFMQAGAARQWNFRRLREFAACCSALPKSCLKSGRLPKDAHMPQTLLERYREMVRSGEINADSAQALAVEKLQDLADRLASYTPPAKTAIFPLLRYLPFKNLLPLMRR
jgi:predicted ATPase